MNATERARRSDSLYFDNVSRRELCDKVAFLESDMEDIKKERTASPIVVSDKDTDCATGHCECSRCRNPIDPWDCYCKHCGARMEE